MSYVTEPPFSGQYTDHFEKGIYLCKKCKTPLYESLHKFHSGCGWPSFDEELPEAVEKQQDADGERVEIRCAHCHAHLGHIFSGECYTPTNTRHCVNSYSLEFKSQQNTSEFAYFGTGCFWCSEAFFRQLKGVIKVTPGYAGGTTNDPTYSKVCSGTTGHAEVVQIEFDPSLISYRDLLSYFWIMHDPTSLNRQENDIGEQYRSIILYTNSEQQIEAENSKMILERDATYSSPIVTQIIPLKNFYKAETYHQNYFENHRKEPYCRRVIEPKILKIRSLQQGML